ncbi:MAG: hypothetical protein JSV86_10545 [Gemmatimonadota bacterium]|nr:MAG: hypothetical protein JSV86_10545 [Gemmatimonadota bacterium]
MMGNRRDPNARWWQMMELYQKNSLEWAIEYCGGVNKAAKYLGLNHGYVYRLCKKLGVDSTIRPYNKQDKDEVEAALADIEAELVATCDECGAAEGTRLDLRTKRYLCPDHAPDGDLDDEDDEDDDEDGDLDDGDDEDDDEDGDLDDEDEEDAAAGDDGLVRFFVDRRE